MLHPLPHNFGCMRYQFKAWRAPGIGIFFIPNPLCSSFNAPTSYNPLRREKKKEETHMKRNQNSIFSTRRLVLMAVLIAIQIVIARYLSVQTPTLRISFETIPLALAGMWLGPRGTGE